MKNQYFGDINDYRKYGLIRALQVEAQLKVLVAWMLTLNDQRRDGELRSYLREPDEWLRFDPELYRGLTDLLDTGVTPRVGLIEESSLLGTADYFSEIVPDAAAPREAWARRLLKAALESEFVFLDPDNGLEVPSRPLGKKGSHEIRVLARGCCHLGGWSFGADLPALPSRETRNVRSKDGRRTAKKNRCRCRGLSYSPCLVPPREPAETFTVVPSRYWANQSLVGA